MVNDNVEYKDLHEIRNNIFKRAALQRTVQGFESSIQELRSQAKPLTRETNETLAGEVKNLEDAKTRLKQREEKCVPFFKVVHCAGHFYIELFRPVSVKT